MRSMMRGMAGTTGGTIERRGGRIEPLGPYLERVHDRFHRLEYLAPDPLVFLHNYSDPADVEVVGFLAALLAYGRVARILTSVESVLDGLGPHPAEAIRRFDESETGSRYAGFVHRWSRGEDLVALFVSLRGTLERVGTLEALFLEGYTPGAPGAARAALSRFVHSLRARAEGRAARARGLPFLLPDAASGSACKRLNLFLRWMVRRDDPLDRGIWRSVLPSDLVMPLDTHVARIARNLGLSSRKTADWRMAAEVTESLRAIDPADPTRFDFAICRLGILDECPTRLDWEKCLACELRPACRLHASFRPRRGGSRAAPTSGTRGRKTSR